MRFIKSNAKKLVLTAMALVALSSPAIVVLAGSTPK